VPQLATLFQVLDADESGEISFDEMQLGLQVPQKSPNTGKDPNKEPY
jgi:Ca2+-binding EF-hand superfamily protein